MSISAAGSIVQVGDAEQRPRVPVRAVRRASILDPTARPVHTGSGDVEWGGAARGAAGDSKTVVQPAHTRRQLGRRRQVAFGLWAAVLIAAVAYFIAGITTPKSHAISS